jgi:DNA-binding transcriptional LysR family regulator
MFDTDLLRSFAAIVDAGSFTRAAERLHLTQPAVSAQLRRLEAQVGSPLLVRSTRTIALTQTGETLLAYARSILQLNKDAASHLKRGGHARRLRIGTSQEFASGWFPKTICRFLQKHPAATIDVELAPPAVLFDGLNEGRYDLVLASRCSGERRGTVLWSDPLVWTFSRQREVPSAPVPLALFPEPCPIREVALAALADGGYDWQVNFVSSGLDCLLELVQHGFAACPLPASLLGPGLRTLDRADGFPDLPNVEFLVAVGSGIEIEYLDALHDAVIAAGRDIADRLKIDQAAD